MNIIQETNSPKITFYCLLILLFCCLASFWPLTFHVFSLKNDALNYFLPVRHQISEAISNGYWPFWSPYFNLGYPLHGDMQSGVWNPFVQIISLFGPYTLQTLQYETLLYIYLSGVGMFFLINYFLKDWRISLLIAASFMLCGFNSDSCQFLNWICSTSFLPFIFLFYYRTLVEKNWKTALICGIFLYLLFTTAYPADFILTGYLLFFVLLWHLFQKRNRTKNNLRSLLLLNLSIFICFFLLSLPAIISYIEFLPLTERGAGASYELAMSNPLHPGLLLSYVTPLPTWKASFASITDPLERNSYFGLIPFSFFVISFFIRFESPIVRFLKWAFIISLLFSFGEFGGIRVLAYYTLPLMNAFRHPANERVFTIFLACLLAAFAFQKILNNNTGSSTKKKVWFLIVAVFGGLLAWSLDSSLTLFSIHKVKTAAQLKLFLDNLNFTDLLFINIIIQTPFLIAIYFWLVKRTNWKWLLVTALINSGIHAFLFQPLTVVKKDSACSIQSVLNTVQQKGYPSPDLNATLLNNSKAGMDLFDEIGVSNLYNKKIGRVDYRITPSNLLKQNEFWFNYKIRDLLFQYPIFYKADTIISNENSFKADFFKKIVLLDEARDVQAISNMAEYIARVKEFSPLSWEIEVECKQPGFYCLFQNDYTRWQLFVDGKWQKIERCNISFIGFRLPAGKHLVFLKYKTSDLAFSFFASIISLIIIFLALMTITQKPPSSIEMNECSLKDRG